MQKFLEIPRDKLLAIAKKLDVDIPKTITSKIDILNKIIDILDQRDRVSTIRMLGVEGRDGKVYEVVYQGKRCALKQFKPEKSKKDIQKEAKFLELASSHGISPKVYCVDLTRKYIISELLHETLFDRLKHQNGKMSLPQQQQLIGILDKLDQIEVYHGDPSPLNFMFDSKDRLYAIDYGFAKLSKNKKKSDMLLGFILQMKNIGIDVDHEYSLLKTHISNQDLKKCGLKA